MIHNIHIIHTNTAIEYQHQVERDAKLIKAHRRGQHKYGNMRRECPLCQLNK